MSNRDDFPKKIINTLRLRVSNRCSNPDCRVPTTGPTTDPEKVNNIGIAAHITAASPGGPRYDSSLSTEERKSISNALWLCSICSIRIDRDTSKYGIDDLNNWKKIAEQKADEEVGKKLPDDNYVIESLTTVLTGQSSAFLPNIISNACKASSNALEKLDPRFSVKANHNDGLTNFEIRAKETVETKLLISSQFADEFFEKYTNFEKHGEKFVIDSLALEIDGSPLLNEIFSQKGRLEITTNLQKKSIQKIWLVNPVSSEILPFYDILGISTIGTNSINFEGSCCEKILSMKYRIPIEHQTKTNINFTFSINFNRWDNKNILTLPYFDSIHEFFKRINEGWQVNLSLEIDGKKILAGSSNDIHDSEYFKLSYSQLNYISAVKGICMILNTPVKYNHAYEYTAEEHYKMIDINQILSSGIGLDRKSITKNASCTLEANEDISNIQAVIDGQNTPTTIRFEQLEQEEIAPFSQPILLPRFNHTLSEVKPIIKTDISDLSPGDLVLIEWEPTENSTYIIKPINPTNA